jgi:hypothetical protein
LPLLSSSVKGTVLPPGSPLSTPDTEHPTVNMNLCEKCEKDIHQVAIGIMSQPNGRSSDVAAGATIAPPPSDMPWLSKIPRPCPPVENPEVSRLKGATSTGNLAQLIQSQQLHSVSLSPMQRSKSNLEPSSTQHSRLALATGGSCRTPPPMRRDLGTPPPHPNTPPAGSKRAPSPLTRSSTPNLSYSNLGGSGEKKSLIPKISGSSLQQQQQRKTPSASSDPSGSSMKQKDSSIPSSPVPPGDSGKSFIPRVVTPPALRKMFPNKDSAKSGGSATTSNTDKNLVRR